VRKLFGFIFCFLFVNNLSSQNFDIDLLSNIQSSRSERLTPSFKTISNSVYPVVVAVPITYFSAGLIMKNKKYTQYGVQATTSIISDLVLTTALKYSIQRKRPYEKYPFIFPLQKENTPSFPSGHTSLAFNTATFLSLNFPKWYVIVPAYVYASVVAYSRLYLGVHYPSDIIGGMIVGSATAYLNFRFYQWYLKKKESKYSKSDEYHY
jgi:membrane-associated phospholipid phosphatase